MSKSKKLVFFGNERLATAVDTSAPTLRALIDAGYDIGAVVINYTPGVSRSAKRLEIAEVAHNNHIPVMIPRKLSEISDQLKELGAMAGVLVAYGKIIPQSIINIFPAGIINIHPSLLPRYRGPTPIETAILDGAEGTGVSLMKLVAKMDAGPLYDKAALALNGNESKQEMADKLLRLGSELLIKGLPAILGESLETTAQVESQASYTKLFTKDDSLLDWSKPALRLQREVRAFLGWPRSITRVHGQKIIVIKAKVASAENDGDLVMRCQPGWLEIQELIAPSGRTVSGADFLRGYKN
jgi:methionyl-tRNA formyltransferase